MARLVVIRHAPVVEKGICYGRYNPRTENVVEKMPELSIALRELLARETSPVKLMSSPSKRCVEIATWLRESLNLDLIWEDRLQELSMGDWEGRAFSELEKIPEFSQWMNNWKTRPPPGGEAPSDLERRVRDWIRGLGESCCVVVAHAGVVRTLRVLLESQTWEDAMSGPVSHLHPYLFNTNGFKR